MQNILTAVLTGLASALVVVGGYQLLIAGRASQSCAPSSTSTTSCWAGAARATTGSAR